MVSDYNLTSLAGSSSVDTKTLTNQQPEISAEPEKKAFRESDQD